MEDHSSTPSSDDSNADDKNVYTRPWNQSSDESDWDAEYNSTVKINENAIEDVQEVKEEEKKTENVQEIKGEEKTQSNEPKVTYQFHSTLATTSTIAKEEVKKERNNSKRHSNSHSKLPGTSTMHSDNRIPKKGVNIKNKDTHIASQSSSNESDLKKRKNDTKHSTDSPEKKIFKKNIEIRDSAHSQGLTSNKYYKNVKNSISNTKTSNKGKISTSSSLKRFPIKADDLSLPSTSDIKKKKKGKKSDEVKEDIKVLTECLIYNTLNDIPEVDEIVNELSSSHLPTKNTEDDVATEIPNIEVPNVVVPSSNDVCQQILDSILTEEIFSENLKKSNAETSEIKNRDIANESVNPELSHASREALFDPNSETDMLEEFEIPPAPPLPPPITNPNTEHPNVIIIGFNSNDEEPVVLPDHADPFPNWLLQLLGANVEEGESHDEPHFYCQGDGIGVHPSIIEVEIDEEESTSDSSSSHDEAEAEHTISESGVVPLPSDDVDTENTPDDSTIVDVSVPLSLLTSPGNTSAADSADEYFDSIENVAISERQNVEINKRK